MTREGVEKSIGRLGVEEKFICSLGGGVYKKIFSHTREIIMILYNIKNLSINNISTFYFKNYILFINFTLINIFETENTNYFNLL